MPRDILARLAELQPLRRTARVLPCKICGAPSPLFDVVDFNKYCSSDAPYEFGIAGVPVPYYRCGVCELVFSDLIDGWSAEEVARYIYNDDYILVDPEYREARPKHVAGVMSAAMRGLEDRRMLDYGSGAGVFALEMGRQGYRDMSCYDPFSSPSRPSGLFDVITCFEVVEHSADPLATFADIESLLAPSGIMLIGQTVQPHNIEEIRGAWWYLGPRNGHVSTYSLYTFSELARRRGYELRPGGALYAFRRSAEPPAPHLLPLLQRVGTPWSGVVRLAPADGADASGQWHKPEICRATPFRWTAAPDVDLGPLALDAAGATFKLPFLMEIEPGFAQRCAFQLDGADIPTRVEGSYLIGETGALPPRVYTIGLRTPEPLTPHSVNGAPDDRPLGLAVRSLYANV